MNDSRNTSRIVTGTDPELIPDLITSASRESISPTRACADPDPICSGSTNPESTTEECRPTSNVSTDSSSTSQNATEPCEGCERLAAHLADAEAQMSEMAQRVAGLELQLRRAGSAEVALRNELATLREEDPDNPEVKKILELWRDLCKDGSKRVNVTLRGPRPDRVRWAIKKYNVERVTNAVKGAPLDDWAMGRDPRTSGRQYNDIAKHILRDEESIERFEGLHLNRDKPKPEPAPKPRQRDASFDPIQELLGRLEHVKTAGDHQWSARCPAHDDRHASLSIGRGRKGAVVHCHTGCTPQKIADALRVPLADWFEPEIPEAPVRPKLEVVAEPLPSDADLRAWNARLVEHDKLLERLQVVKGWHADTLMDLGVGWDGERIVFPVFDGNGALQTIARYLPGGKPKMLGLKHRPRGLFPAPETIDGTVWIVEGEPDAVTGHELGIGAVAVPGANGWRQDFNDRLQGRDVVICMDCDDEGRTAAQKVATALHGIAADVEIVDIDPSRSDRYDLTDFAKEGGTADLLQAMRTEARKAA